jgi:peroxiredoxin
MLAFIDRHGITFPTIADQSGEVYLRYEVPYQPAYVFIDAQGDHTRVMGTLTGDELREWIGRISA